MPVILLKAQQAHALMPGEKNLNRLLASLSPTLLEGEFVFCSFKNVQYGSHRDLYPIAAIEESEGLTLVIPKENADQRQIKYAAVFKKITLQVLSSLEAVGLTAVVATSLAARGISANVVAGYFHDHIFVPETNADQAIAVLQELTLRSQTGDFFQHDISKMPQKK